MIGVTLGFEPADLGVSICSDQHQFIIRVVIHSIPKLLTRDSQFGWASLRPLPSHRQELVGLL
jgi:hypothetical protein